MADDFKAWTDKVTALGAEFMAEEWVMEEARKRVDARKDFSMAGLIAEVEAMQYPPETVAKVQSIILRRPQAASAAKAAERFAILIEVVEQIWKTTPIKPKESLEDYRERIRNPVISILRAKGVKKPGLGKLKKALGVVRRK
jgi:hypothetical protein